MKKGEIKWIWNLPYSCIFVFSLINIFMDLLVFHRIRRNWRIYVRYWNLSKDLKSIKNGYRIVVWCKWVGTVMASGFQQYGNDHKNSVGVAIGAEFWECRWTTRRSPICQPTISEFSSALSGKIFDGVFLRVAPPS